MLRPDRIAGPSPTRTVTPELAPAGSPRSSVGYHYAGKQPIPAAGLAPARHAALWAACRARRERRATPDKLLFHAGPGKTIPSPTSLYARKCKRRFVILRVLRGLCGETEVLGMGVRGSKPVIVQFPPPSPTRKKGAQAKGCQKGTLGDVGALMTFCSFPYPIQRPACRRGLRFLVQPVAAERTAAVTAGWAIHQICGKHIAVVVYILRR